VAAKHAADRTQGKKRFRRRGGDTVAALNQAGVAGDFLCFGPQAVHF